MGQLLKCWWYEFIGLNRDLRGEVLGTFPEYKIVELITNKK
jgi:hypothetical protein